MLHTWGPGAASLEGDFFQYKCSGQAEAVGKAACQLVLLLWKVITDLPSLVRGVYLCSIWGERQEVSVENVP